MERRKKKDFLSGFLIGLNILAWVLILPILLIFHRAQPEFETFFDRFYGLDLRTFWDIRYLYILVYLVMLGMIMSLTGLILSLFRGRRQGDQVTSLVVMGLISFLLLMISLYHL
ncbi:MAG: hypothetical protein D3926_17475 [Desulfobacteraceae bacterium]|nr:MAG: hypothetical protein D3926_17475 [Desulfobacteraceae bacterium]